MSVDLMSANVNTIERIMERLIRIEYGTVVRNDTKKQIVGVQCRDDPESKYWNTVTVRFRNSKTRLERKPTPKKVTGTPDKVFHYYCTVLQRYTQKWAGEPYTPRIGDMVAVLFIHNQKPLVLGTINTDTQDSVCRAPFADKKWDKIDARYDYVKKWCQWTKPRFNDNEEVVEHYPGRHPICEKIFHRTRDQIRVTDCRQGDKDSCKECKLLDHICRCSNQWEKIYSCDTDSCDCQHPYLPKKCCSYTKRRHEWHEPCGSYFVYQNNPCCDLDFGKGLIRIGNATCETCQKAHINMNPRGTVDIHTFNEPQTTYADEHQGTRMSVVALDDNTVDHSFEAKDFDINSWIEILKEGSIDLVSTGTDNSRIYIKGPSDVVEIYGTANIKNYASNDILESCATHTITGECVHGDCSCSKSDRRVKENITNVNDGLNKVDRLRSVSFNFITSPEKRHIGFVAQDVQEVIPEVVQEHSDGMLGIRYDELIPVLTKAIQELNEKVNILEYKLKEHGIE